jgi:branched-chain amino acid transport system substrate-binding protein
MRPTVSRRTLMLGTAAIAVGGASAAWAQKATPGVTATEIKIGNTNPHSGPASAYGAIAELEDVFFNKMVNDQGGVGGRKINYLSLDDGYSPPKAVEQVRRLVEQEEVAFLFNPLGTPSNTAIQKYCNQKKVPQLLVATGADKWGDYQHFPWTMGFAPSYRTEAQIYTKHILENKPGGKIGIIYQNDDFGKDYVAGVKDVLGGKYDSMVVKAVTYEVTDATIDSQINTLQASGADVLITAATPKFGAMIIRKVFDVNWKPLHLLTNVSISVASVMEPAGPEKGVGIITAAYLKDPTDPTWKDDPGMNEFRAFMAKYMPKADMTDGNYTYAYGVSVVMLQVLKQCGTDFSRENIMKQAANLHDLVVPTVLPGIKVNTSPTNYHPVRAMQLQKWTGKTWSLFGSVIQGAT